MDMVDNRESIPNFTSLNRLYEKNLEKYSGNLVTLEKAYDQDEETIHKIFEGASKGILEINKGLSYSSSDHEYLNLLKDCKKIMESYQEFISNLDNISSSETLLDEELKAYSISREVEQNLGQMCEYLLEAVDQRMLDPSELG